MFEDRESRHEFQVGPPSRGGPASTVVMLSRTSVARRSPWKCAARLAAPTSPGRLVYAQLGEIVKIRRIPHHRDGHHGEGREEGQEARRPTAR